MTTVAIIASIFLVSAVSLVGIVLLSLRGDALRRLLPLFVSFAAGALLGSVFVHLLPEALQSGSQQGTVLPLVLAGILLSFALEQGIRWRHCHVLDCVEHAKPFGMMMLIGDSIHNLLDGILIASSYLVSFPLGISTTVAVLLHEIPQEVGDFAVLLHSGYSRSRALFLNVVTALTAFGGAFIVLFLSSSVSHIETAILPLTAGHFLYIAAADLLPELHKEVRMRHAAVQFLCILAGLVLLFIMG